MVHKFQANLNFTVFRIQCALYKCYHSYYWENINPEIQRADCINLSSIGGNGHTWPTMLLSPLSFDTMESTFATGPDHGKTTILALIELLALQGTRAQSTYKSDTDGLCVDNLHTVVKIWGLGVKVAHGRFKMQTFVKFWFHFSHMWKQCQLSAPSVVWASFTINISGSDSNVLEGTSVWHSRILMFIKGGEIPLVYVHF